VLASAVCQVVVGEGKLTGFYFTKQSFFVVQLAHRHKISLMQPNRAEIFVGNWEERTDSASESSIINVVSTINVIQAFVNFLRR
jgi:hypothetical protein